MPRPLLLVLLFLAAALWWVGHRSSAPLAATTLGGGIASCPAPPPAVDINEPRQSDVAGKLAPLRMGAATISPLAGFSVLARVLAREDYSVGWEAAYSPTDLALGWGPMSQLGLAERLHVEQSGRWYRYSWGREGPPIAPAQIQRNSANMHLVPADRSVADALSRVGVDDIVRVNGWLIRIDADNGRHWKSSLSRDDSGAGACELVLVCSIERR